MSTNARPAAATVQTGSPSFKPYEVDADLHSQEMARQLIEKLGTPTITTPELNAYIGILKSLKNNDVMDCSILIDTLDTYSKAQINDQGKYFERIWAYLMKPKMVIPGMPYPTSEEEKPTVLQRLTGFIFNRGNGAQVQNGNK